MLKFMSIFHPNGFKEAHLSFRPSLATIREAFVTLMNCDTSWALSASFRPGPGEAGLDCGLSSGCFFRRQSLRSRSKGDLKADLPPSWPFGALKYHLVSLKLP